MCGLKCSLVLYRENTKDEEGCLIVSLRGVLKHRRMLNKHVITHTHKQTHQTEMLDNYYI